MSKFFSDGLVFESDRPIEVHEMVWCKQLYRNTGCTGASLADGTTVAIRPAEDEVQPAKRFNSPNSGKRKPWQFMTKFEISFNGDVYMVRWRLIQTPYFGIYLHKFLRGDADPFVHDHPWAFISFVLRGGYTEMVRNNFTHEINPRHVKRVNVKRRDDAHFVGALDRVPTWTLVFRGRQRRTWGFWIPTYAPHSPEVPRQTWIEFEDFNKNGWSGKGVGR